MQDTWSINSDALSDDDRVQGIEHTNDIVLGKNKISKSSGRLWMSGIDKSMKRMSVTEESYNLENDLEPTASARVSSLSNGHSGHVPVFETDSDSDDLGEVAEYLFDRDAGPIVSSSEVIVDISHISEGRHHGSDFEVQDIDDPVILYCSHL